MTAIWRWRSLLLPSLAAAFVLVLPARSEAVYGELDHYEVCQADGSFASIRSIAVDPQNDIYVADEGGTIYHLGSNGVVLGSISTGPNGPFQSPVVDNGPAGIVYVADQSQPVQLVKYSVAGPTFTVQHVYDTTTGGYMTTAGLRSPASIVATSGDTLVIIDATQGIVTLRESDGAFLDLTLFHNGDGRAVGGELAYPGLVYVANTNDSGQPDNISVYGPRSGSQSPNERQYGYTFRTSPSIQGLTARGTTPTIWALTNGGFEGGVSGLQNFSTGGMPMDTVPIPGGGYALDQGPDGSLYVARNDGILRIGPNGGPIPPSVYGHATCGGPQITDSFPRGPGLIKLHGLRVKLSCNEPCTLQGSGTMTIAHTTYRLTTVTRSDPSGGPITLTLRVPQSSIGALKRTKARHGRGSMTINLAASDAAGTRRAIQVPIRIS